MKICIYFYNLTEVFIADIKNLLKNNKNHYYENRVETFVTKKQIEQLDIWDINYKVMI
jgi:hypothetical protein